MHWDREFYQKILKSVPHLTVDGVVVDEVGAVLLTKRAIGPFKGYWHLPGGHVHYKERVEKAVVRVVKEETGIEVEVRSLINVYSDPKRDDRGHFVTVGYLLKPVGGKLVSDWQSEAAKYWKKLPEKMGFDAREIAGDGLMMWRALK